MASTTANGSIPDWFDRGLSDTPVMAVLRGMSPAETVQLSIRAWDIGITQVEIPIETPDAVPSLRAAVEAGRDRGRKVGAGTILDGDQLRSATLAGAAYAVSPGFDAALIALANGQDLPILPGISTPSEILFARNLGFRWIKAFPASVLGASWFSAMRGPFPDIRLVATGGMDGDNASTFLQAGASVVGVGSALRNEAQTEKLRQLIAQCANREA